MWNEHFENIVAVMVHGFWSVLDILGVTFAMAILILSTKGFEYKGCFWNDNLERLYSIAQNGEKFYNNTILNSTVVCFEHCIAGGFMYAGTEANTSSNVLCCCGDDLTTVDAYGRHECGGICPVKTTDMCGAYSRLAVYFIGNDTHISLPDDSYDISTTQGSPIDTNLTSTMDNSACNDSTTTETYPDTSPTNNLGQNCMCPCTSIGTKWDYLDGLNLTREQLLLHLSKDLLELTQSITTDVKKTSAYLNKKKSASDNRSSSIVLGYFGSVMIIIPIILIIGCDISRGITNKNAHNYSI